MTRRFATLALIALALAPTPPAMAQTPTVTAVEPTPDERARQWLTLIDDSNYTQGIAQMVQQTRKADIENLSRLREPLGAMAERNLKEIALDKRASGLPSGQYAVVRYQSRFANRTTAIETVTLAMTKAGWTVVRYHVE